MSAAPEQLSRVFNFSDFEQTNPNTPKPGPQLDAEFNNSVLAINTLITRLGEIQRNDGFLKNQIVTPEALSPIILTLIGGFNPNGIWAPGRQLKAKDLVVSNGVTFVAILDHLSVDLAADIGASKLVPLSAAFGDGDHGDIVSATGGLSLTINPTLLAPFGRSLLPLGDEAAWRAAIGALSADELPDFPDLSAFSVIAANETLTGAKTFTQAINTRTGASLQATLFSENNNTATGAILNMRHTRGAALAAVANDIIGIINLSGNNAAFADTTFAAIRAVVESPNTAAESGRIELITRRAGAGAVRASIGAGLFMAGATGADKGAGSVNATAYFLNGAAFNGKVAQAVRDTEATYSSTATIIPLDDTIPQQTEGVEIMSVSITPTNASSKIRIRAVMMIATNTGGVSIVVALFQDATAPAIKAQNDSGSGNAAMSNSVILETVVNAGSTAARAYKIRVGPGTAGTAFVNGDGTSRNFGGVANCTLEVEEILP